MRVFFSPPLRGGVSARSMKSRAASLARADGVVSNFQNEFLEEFSHHPVRSIKEASRHFIVVAATPPRRGGENGGPLRLGTAPFRPGLISYSPPALFHSDFRVA